MFSGIIREVAKLLIDNFWLKLLSILFSVVLFFIVRSGQDAIYERVAKLHIVTMPHMVVIGSQDRYVNVSVRVQNSLFSVAPSEEELSGQVNILAETPNKLTVKISRDNFPHLPKHYSLILERPYIEVEMDRRMEKFLPIVPIFRGQPAAGLAIGQIIVSPKETRVVGAKQELMPLDHINTSPVIIDGINSDLNTLAQLDNGGRTSLKFSDAAVKVTIKLKNAHNPLISPKIRNHQ